jgi:hypothetical protein
MVPVVEPGVRVLLEDTGAIVGMLPVEPLALTAGDEIVLSEGGGPSTTYKVEKVRYTADCTHIHDPTVPHAHTVYGRIDYIVSEVP